MMHHETFRCSWYSALRRVEVLDLTEVVVTAHEADADAGRVPLTAQPLTRGAVPTR